ncbi:MAG: GYD domain-containing protein [Chloroflexota bacterium]|nr:GYD domain-containing protein [Chloroflexota bacterium]
MPTYITLGKYTDQGIRDIKDAPNRVDAVQQAVQQAGGRFVGWYLTFGEFDFVSIEELPDDEKALGLLLRVGQQGNVHTTTLRAFSRQEVEQVVATL